MPLRTQLKGLLLTLGLVLLVSSTSGASGFSDGATAKKPEVSRDILALWVSDKDNQAEFSNTYIHLKLETILNYYGFKVSNQDVKMGLPQELYNPEYMKKFAGIVTWFDGPILKDSPEYVEWLRTQIKNQKKLLVLGSLGVRFGKKKGEISERELNQKLSSFGMVFNERFLEKPLFHQITKSNSKMMDFERDLKGEINSYQLVHSTSPLNEVHLQLSTKNVEQSESDVVWTGPHGGYAQSGFELFVHPVNFSTQWRINPFLFVSKALSLGEYPVPDVTTIDGSRIFYAHIDGDGFTSISEVDHTTDCGKLIMEKVLKHYQLPHSISVIIAEIAPEITSRTQPRDEAREIFSLPYVEAASHTYSHPLSWRLNPTAEDIRSYVGEGKSSKGPIVSFKIKNYKMNYEKEIVGSINYINHTLLPPEKKSKIVFWSGSCLPTEDALKVAQENHIDNINGGDSTFDLDNPSYTKVAPLTRQVGAYTQIYSTNSNENVYTHLWTGPFNGYRRVVETFVNTETPLRIRPINIYYHFYSGEKISALESVMSAYDYAITQPIIPVFVSDYIETVKGFLSTKIKHLGAKDFEITDTGELKTFRFDRTRDNPDYIRSKNVIGHMHYQGNLYVFLGSANHTRITLTAAEPTRVYLKKSNFIVKNFKVGLREITIEGRSLISPEITLANLPKNKKFIVSGKTFVSDSVGNLTIGPLEKGDLNLVIKI